MKPIFMLSTILFIGLSLIELRGFYISDIELDITPKLTAAEAKKNVVLNDGRKITENLLLVFAPQEGEPHLSWRLKVLIGGSLPEKYVFVDANTGEIIDEWHLISD